MAGRPKADRFGTLSDVAFVGLKDKKEKILNAFFPLLEPQADLWLDEWADQFFVLPRETSAEYGQWRTSRTPYLRRPLRCLSPQSSVKIVTFVSGTQLGKTTLSLIWFSYSAERNPGPLMYVRETEDAVKEFSEEKLKPTIAACSVLDGILGKDKPKNLTNTTTSKHFPGGFIVLGSAGSEIVLRGKSIRDVVADEVDAYPKDVKAGGSPLENLRNRQDTFSAFGKMLIPSTPKIKETSIIWPSFESGTKEHYYLPCPFCNKELLEHGAYFKIEWEDIRYSKDDLDSDTGYPKRVWVSCPSCAAEIEEIHKTWMLEHGRWLAQKEDGSLYEVGYDVDHVSLRLPSFYSPLGFLSWHTIVERWYDYLKTKDVLKLQVFINQICAKPFTLAGTDLNSSVVSSHIEEYINLETGEVVDLPDGVLCVTSGVDVQKDRIECEVVGWGLYGESWSVDYQVFWGNTELLGDVNGMDPNTEQPTCWALLDTYLMSRFKHANGRDLGIECTLIDSRYRGEPVNAFCRLREGRRIYPSLGFDKWSKGFIVRPKKRSEKWGTWTVAVNVNEVKDLLYNQFTISEPGPGFCHFPNKSIYDEKYFFGLTCENRKTRLRGGVKELFWECPVGARNEPLDCRVYAFAALEWYGVNLHVRSQQLIATRFNIGGINSNVPIRSKRRVGRGHPGF